MQRSCRVLVTEIVASRDKSSAMLAKGCRNSKFSICEPATHQEKPCTLTDMHPLDPLHCVPLPQIFPQRLDGRILLFLPSLPSPSLLRTPSLGAPDLLGMLMHTERYYTCVSLS